MRKICLLLLFPVSVSVAQTKFPYKNLALEGGGTRGIAYAGAIRVLEENQVLSQIENVAGTSAGSIAAMLIAVGYSGAEIDSLMRDLDLGAFNDGGGGALGKYKRVKKSYGLYRGIRFENWLGELIRTKTGSDTLTFSQLHELHSKQNRYKDLYCTGTNITHQRLDIFSWKNTPQMHIKTAVHISSCVPFYFKPVLLDSLMRSAAKPNGQTKYDYYVDGGMLANYPINMFDSCRQGGNPFLCEDVIYNKETIGLKLERSEQLANFNNNDISIPHFDITTLDDYSKAVFNLLMETLNRRPASLQNEKGRTIYINQGQVSFTINNMAEEEKMKLYNNGKEAAEKFLKDAEAALPVQ